jgi:hypothetical protein
MAETAQRTLHLVRRDDALAERPLVESGAKCPRHVLAADLRIGLDQRESSGPGAYFAHLVTRRGAVRVRAIKLPPIESP